MIFAVEHFVVWTFVSKVNRWKARFFAHFYLTLPAEGKKVEQQVMLSCPSLLKLWVLLCGKPLHCGQMLIDTKQSDYVIKEISANIALTWFKLLTASQSVVPWISYDILFDILHPSLTDHNFQRFFGKKKTSLGRHIFHQVERFCQVAVLPFWNIQMIYAGYMKVAPGKPHTGRVKLKIQPGTAGRLIFTGWREKIHWVCYRGVLLLCELYLQKVEKIIWYGLC